MSHRPLRCLAALAAALVLGLPSTAWSQAAAKPPAGKARTIEMQGTDSLKFVPATIQAKPGETIRLVLKTISTMPKMAMAHNFVLLTLEADVNAFVNESMRSRATDYIAPKRKGEVLAATGLAGGGETVEVTFTAPAKPGTYTFVCTFPGHFAGGMKGTLTVK
jgi:azurin